MRIIPIVVKGKVFPLDYVPRIRSEGPPRPPHQARESLERGKGVRRKGRKEGRKGGREEGRGDRKSFLPSPFLPPSFVPSLSSSAAVFDIRRRKRGGILESP